MKKLPLILLLLINIACQAQQVEVYTFEKNMSHLTGWEYNDPWNERDDSISKNNGIELFGKGLLDYGFEGQLQATAQAVKVNVGEPNAIYIPIYLLIGATNGDFGASELNKGTVMSIINPCGGTLNLSTNFYIKLYSSRTGITSLKYNSFLAGKLVSGRDNLNESIIKPSMFFDGGLFFQTGAWLDEDGYKDGGVFWLQAKYTASYLSRNNIEEFFNINTTNEILHGPRIEMGIFIENRVNIKLSFMKIINDENIPTLDKGQFRVGLDYSVVK